MGWCLRAIRVGKDVQRGLWLPVAQYPLPLPVSVDVISTHFSRCL